MTVSIAIIDSGVNPAHPHVQKVSGGHAYVMNSKGQVEKKQDFMDQVGHGTAISGIIHQKIPLADLYFIKIFQQDLSAQAPCLIHALEWAIKKSFKIIHLSLGIYDGDNTDELRVLCEKAHSRNIIIVASAKSPFDIVYPASFPNVIGVYWNPDCSKDQIVYHPDTQIEFGAHGFPRDIPGLPRERNFKGSSFAAAHITARVAQLLAVNSGTDICRIKNRMEQEAKAIVKLDERRVGYNCK